MLWREVKQARLQNKRAEMWANMKDWLKEGGVIPEDDQTLADDLMGPETVPNTSGLIQLESKEAMKSEVFPLLIEQTH